MSLVPANPVTLPAALGMLPQVTQLAKTLCNTNFVPKAYRGKPAEITACILFGAELGLGPMQSLNHIDIIEGNPTPNAQLGRALLLRAGHRLRLIERSATRCVVEGLRAGDPDRPENWVRIEWTIDMARQRNLAHRDQWKKQPEHMLFARATSDLARAIAPDDLAGISVFAEEMDQVAGVDVKVVPDGVDVETGEITAAPVTHTRSLRPTPEPEPEVEDAVVVDTTVEERPASGFITDAQIRKIMVLYGELGVKDRAAQKRNTAALLGLEQLGSHKELSREQAGQVIEALQAEVDAQPSLLGDDGRPF